MRLNNFPIQTDLFCITFIFFLSFSFTVLQPCSAQDLIENTKLNINPSTPETYAGDNIFDIKLKSYSDKDLGEEQKLFSISKNRNVDYQKHAKDAVGLTLDKSQLKKIIKNKTDLLKLEIPVGDQHTFKLQLVKANSISKDFRILNASGKNIIGDTHLGVHYHGIIEGDHSSFASVSITDGQLQMLIADRNGNYSISRTGKDDYVLFNEFKLVDDFHFHCGNSDENISTRELDIIKQSKELASKQIAKSPKARDRIEFIIEMDNDLWNALGDNVANCYDYSINLIRNAADVFERDGMSIQLNGVIIWQDTDPTDPFNDINALVPDLQNWAANIRTNFSADLVYYIRALSPGGAGGVAQGLGGVCDKQMNVDEPTAHSVTQGAPIPYTETGIAQSINDNLGGFFMASRFLKLFCHENGHVLGSRHTHACVWNGNNTQIDDCGNEDDFDNGNTPEGNACFDSNNPILPAVNGNGTIMSYCDRNINGVIPGINYVLGFDPQPRDVMIATITANGCLSTYEEFCPEVEVIEEDIGSTVSGTIYDAEDDLLIYDGDVLNNSQQVTFSAGDETIIYGNFTSPLGVGLQILLTGCSNN